MDSLLSGEVLLWPQSKLELNPMHVYTDASPVKVNGTYSQVSVDRISALIVPMHCCVTPSCIMLLWCGKWPQEGNIWQNISQKWTILPPPYRLLTHALYSEIVLLALFPWFLTAPTPYCSYSNYIHKRYIYAMGHANIYSYMDHSKHKTVCPSWCNFPYLNQKRVLYLWKPV